MWCIFPVRVLHLPIYKASPGGCRPSSFLGFFLEISLIYTTLGRHKTDSLSMFLCFSISLVFPFHYRPAFSKLSSAAISRHRDEFSPKVIFLSSSSPFRDLPTTYYPAFSIWFVIREFLLATEPFLRCDPSPWVIVFMEFRVTFFFFSLVRPDRQEQIFP